MNYYNLAGNNMLLFMNKIWDMAYEQNMKYRLWMKSDI